MSGAFNRCKICTKLIVSESANYCSSQCRKLDSRLYYSKIGLISVLMLVILIVVYAIIYQFSWIYTGMLISALTLMVLIPLYQFYQSMRIEKKMRIMYNKSSTHYTQDGRKVQPVYIYLYINRHTEEMYPDEDYSEYV